jgi:LmbE family N-acetylglucosaminyl deacetylase
MVLACHPDDDTLGFGAMIRKEMAAGKKVYVFMVTNGSATNVIAHLNGQATNAWCTYTHSPAAEQYPTVAGVGLPLQQTDVEIARQAEFEQAMLTLGVAGFRYGSFPDGDVASFQADLRAAVLQYAADIGGMIDLKAHTWINKVGTTVVEDHPDHLAVGAVAKAIAASAPAWLASLRYFIIWGLHGTSFPGLNVGTISVTGEDAGRVVMAARCYGAWASQDGRYAFGEHSVHSAIAAMEAANGQFSLYHA